MSLRDQNVQPRRLFEDIKDDEDQIRAVLEADSQEEERFPFLVCVNPRASANSPLPGPSGAEIATTDMEVSPAPSPAQLSEISSIGSYNLSDTSDIEIISMESSVGGSTLARKPAKVAKKDYKGRGRALDPAWDDFHRSEDGKTVFCNWCDRKVSDRAPRLKDHLLVCKKYGAPTALKVVAVSGRKSVPVASSQGTIPDRSAPSSGSSSNTPKRLKRLQPKMSSFIDRATKKEQQRCHMEVARYIYSMNLPFTHVEHPAFHRFVTQLRPAVALPNRKAVAGHLLNKTYEQVVEKRDEQLVGKLVTILQDGWKTKTSDPVVAHSVKVGNETFFLEAIGTAEMKKSGKNCAKMFEKVIEKMHDLGAKTNAGVTDNCKSMEKMRKIINENHPDIFTYGCHAHLLNLIGKEFTPQDELNKVKVVHIFFRNHEKAWSLLKKEKASRPKLPCDTRWNAWLDCLEYYLENHTKMLNVARKKEVQIDADVYGILSDGEFYKTIQETVTRMKPVQVALDKVQSASATLADGVNIWIDLKEKLDLDITLHDYFFTQYERALQPVGIAAYMFHPQYRGQKLTPDEIQKGNQFLASFDTLLVIAAAQLKIGREEYFGKEMLSEKVISSCTPDIWWTTLQSLGKVDQGVIDFAIRLMQLPPGSADIERHFSTLGQIMNNRRGRLGIERASKLCVVYKYFATVAPPMFESEVDLDD